MDEYVIIINVLLLPVFQAHHNLGQTPPSPISRRGPSCSDASIATAPENLHDKEDAWKTLVSNIGQSSVFTCARRFTR